MTPTASSTSPPTVTLFVVLIISISVLGEEVPLIFSETRGKVHRTNEKVHCRVSVGQKRETSILGLWDQTSANSASGAWFGVLDALHFRRIEICCALRRP